MGRYIDIHASLDERVEQERQREEAYAPSAPRKRGRPRKADVAGERAERAVEYNTNHRPNMKVVTGQQRRVSNELSLYRTRMQPLMLQLFYDPSVGMDYGAIARRVNEKGSADGYDFVVTAGMVKADIRAALKEQIAKSEGDRDAVWSASAEMLRRVIRDCWTDYERSKSVDAKSEASMLRTLIKDAGMSYDEAMAEIRAKSYSGNPDHFRVMMEALERYAGMHGLSIKAASVALQNQQNGQQNQTGNIVNYNFESVDKDRMRDIVRMLQDGKFESMKEDGDISSPDAQPVDVQDDPDIADDVREGTGDE